MFWNIVMVGMALWLVILGVLDYLNNKEI